MDRDECGRCHWGFQEVDCLFVSLFLFYILPVFLASFFPQEDGVRCFEWTKFCPFGMNRKMIKSFPQRLPFSCELKSNNLVREEGWGGEKGPPTTEYGL